MKFAIAPFVVAYGRSDGFGWSTLTDAVFTIEPPARMCGTAALHEVEHRVDVRAEGAIPLLVGDLLQCGVRALERGVVDEHVDPAEGAHGFLDDVAAHRRVGEVSGHERRVAARLLDPARGLGRVVVLVEICDEHVRALAREGDRDGAADAASPPVTIVFLPSRRPCPT